MGRNVFNANYSEALSLMIEGKDLDKANGTCTGGYDNDGSTGVEIFDNGIALGIDLVKAQIADPDAKLFWGETKDRVCVFVIAATEHAACEQVRSWEPEEQQG